MAEQERFIPQAQRDAARGAEGRLCSDNLTPGLLGHFLAERPQLSVKKRKG